MFSHPPPLKSNFSDFNVATHLAVSIASMAFIENKKYITNSCSVKNFNRLALKFLTNKHYLNLLAFICEFIHYRIKWVPEPPFSKLMGSQELKELILTEPLAKQPLHQCVLKYKVLLYKKSSSTSCFWWKTLKIKL